MLATLNSSFADHRLCIGGSLARVHYLHRHGAVAESYWTSSALNTECASVPQCTYCRWRRPTYMEFATLLRAPCYLVPPQQYLDLRAARDHGRYSCHPGILSHAPQRSKQPALHTCSVSVSDSKAPRSTPRVLVLFVPTPLQRHQLRQPDYPASSARPTAVRWAPSPRGECAINSTPSSVTRCRKFEMQIKVETRNGMRARGRVEWRRAYICAL